MEIYLKKEIKELFNKFDISNKGYLTTLEFDCFCYTILVKPFLKKDKKIYEDIENYKLQKNDHRALFFLFRMGMVR